MSNINVLFGITKPTVEVLRGNFTRNEEDTSYLSNELTDEERARFKTYTTDFWKDEVAGAVTWQVVSSYLSCITVGGRGSTDLELVDVVDALTKFAGQIFVIGAWNPDGSQYGTKLIHTENGVDLVDEYVKVPVYTDVEVIDIEATIANQVYTTKIITKETSELQPTGQQVEVPHIDTTVEGTPYYPINMARAIKYMTDDVTYDESGNETSRVAALVTKEINNILGWKERRWS